jgi:hypothetical protein
MVGTVEDFVAKKREEYPAPELSQFDKDLIGAAVRLEVPFGGRYQLRQIAGILRAYADKVEFWTRQQDVDDRTMLMHLKIEAKLANRRIRDVCDLSGKGKAPKPYRKRDDR